MELTVLLLLLLWCPGLPAKTPVAEMSQREGSTFSIQCPYTTQPDNKQLKAWCRVRNTRCELVVLTSASREYRYSDRARQGHITIQDDNRTVSITMFGLQVEDSGIYSCVYGSNYVPLKTISLNVYKELRKWELDSLSVQCPYRALGYSGGRKAWCRQQGQTECSLVVSTGYGGSRGVWNKSSTIWNNAQTGTVTITMDKLQARDSGVYWCALYSPHQRSAFTRIMEVRLSVDKIPAATTLSVTTGSSHKNSSGNSTQARNTIIISVVLCILPMALAITTALCIRQRKKLKTGGNRQAEDTYDKPESPAQLGSTERTGRTTNDSRDLHYITLDFKPQLSSDEPLYCNIELSQAPRKPKDENVEYAIITHKQLPKNDKG